MKQNNKKQSGIVTLVITILVLILSSSSATAEKLLIIGIENNSLEQLRVIETNEYTNNQFKEYITENDYEDILNNPGLFIHDIRVVTDTTSYELHGFTNKFTIPFDTTIKKIEIRKDNTILFQKELVFCNKNNICEPCQTAGCTVQESAITCSDCNSGSKDYFCDLAFDNRCDPDCEGRDKDCESCTAIQQGATRQNNCLAYSEETQCNEQGGEACFYGKICTTSNAIMINNLLCCRDSYCITPLKNSGSTSESKQKNNTLLSTPSTTQSSTQSYTMYYTILVIFILTITVITAYFMYKSYRKEK